MKSVSIIIPAFNAENFLGEAIRSCLGQTLSPAEILVIDDGSTDGTSAVCRSFGQAVTCQRVENGGVSRARNIGTRQASGEAFVFLDADDRLLPHALESLSKTLEDSGAGTAYGMVIERAAPPAPARLNGFAFAAGSPPVPALRNYWRCAVITPGSAIIRRDLHERIGGFVPGYEPMEDRDYWIKAGLLASCAHADEIVLDKTWRPVSAGKMDARRIWNGLRSRLALPGWCTEQGVSWPDGLPRDPRTLLVSALKEAVWRGCWGIVGPLLEECRKRRVFSLWALRAEMEYLLRGGKTRFPRPDWMRGL